MKCIETGCKGQINEKGMEVPVGCNKGGLIRRTIEVFECSECGRFHAFNEKKDLVGVFTMNEEKVFYVNGKITHRKD